MASLEKTRHERGPLLAISVFCFGLLVVAAFYRGHSFESLDQRTYAQMVRAVAERGLPYWDNGPIDRFPQLVVWWGMPVKGHVWAIYGLLYSYVSAPAFRLGGIEGVSKLTFATLAPIAFVTYLLARRVVTQPWFAVIAGILAIVSTPVLAKALETTAYPLLVLMATLGIYFTVRIVEAKTPSLALGFVFGMTWAAAMGAHAIGISMAPFAFLVAAAAPDPVTGHRTLRLAATRIAPALVGFSCVTLPISMVNHVRFDSYNPVSYGGFPWSGPPKMTIADQVGFALPVAALLFVAAALLFLARKHRLAQAAIVVIAVVAGASIPIVRERIAKFAVVAFAYIVAPGAVDLGPPYVLAADGLGRMIGRWAIVGTLQGIPLLILSLLALRGVGERRWKILAMLLPAAGVFISLTMRANLVSDGGMREASGWPWVYERYPLSAFPALVVASMVVVERLEPRRVHAIVAVVIGLVLAVAYYDGSDSLLTKRLGLLVLPLVCAVFSLIAAYAKMEGGRFSGAAPLLASIVAGLGIASGLGHDLHANVEAKLACDATANRMAAAVPERFALLGPIGRIDVLLSTLMFRDVKYADVNRFPLVYHRSLVDYWRAEGRPIYLAADEMPTSPWPDVTFTRVDTMPEIFLVQFAN